MSPPPPGHSWSGAAIGSQAVGLSWAAEGTAALSLVRQLHTYCPFLFLRDPEHAPCPRCLSSPSLESRDSRPVSLGGCRSKHDGVRFSGLGGPEDLRSASGSPPRPLPFPRLLPEAPEEEEEAEGPLREQDLKGAYIQLVRGMQEWQDGCVYQGEFGLDMKLGYGEIGRAHV